MSPYRDIDVGWAIGQGINAMARGFALLAEAAVAQATPPPSKIASVFDDCHRRGFNGLLSVLYGVLFASLRARYPGCDVRSQFSVNQYSREATLIVDVVAGGQRISRRVDIDDRVFYADDPETVVNRVHDYVIAAFDKEPS